MFNKFLIGTFASASLLFAPVNWGLEHHGNFLPPTPPPSATQLQENNGLYKVDTDKKEVFFTFDLGYEAGYTNEVLDILKANDIKAVFFLCGNYLQETEIIDRIINEGHIIGNHTDRHRDLPTISTDAIKKDIMDLQNNIAEKFPKAKAPTFMRPPQGRYDERVLDVAKDKGFRTMLWSIAIKDWGKSPIDAQSSANTIAKRIHNGAIILLHITNSGMPKTLETLLPILKEQGYSVGNPHKI